MGAILLLAANNVFVNNLPSPDTLHTKTKMSQPQPHAIVESHLTRCDSLCRQWASLQKTSIALLSSIINIATQRHHTQITGHSLANRPTDDALSQLLSDGNLERLLYKQTRALEHSLRQLHACIPRFRALTGDMDRLLSESTKHLSYTLANPPPPSNQPPSLVSVAAIDPTEAHTFVSQIARMYAKELIYKQALLDTLPSATAAAAASVQALEEIGRRWAGQPNVDFGAEEDMCDRLKVYKRVKEAVEKRE